MSGTVIPSFAIRSGLSHTRMPGVDFAKFKTYKWIKIEGAQYPDQITDAQIKTALDEQLATKALTKTDDDTADLYIGYQVAVNQEKQWNVYSMRPRSMVSSAICWLMSSCSSRAMWARSRSWASSRREARTRMRP